jgi:hypothetical protein
VAGGPADVPDLDGVEAGGHLRPVAPGQLLALLRVAVEGVVESGDAAACVHRVEEAGGAVVAGEGGGAVGVAHDVGQGGPVGHEDVRVAAAQGVLVARHENEAVGAIVGAVECVHAVVVGDRQVVEPARLGQRDLLAGAPTQRVGVLEARVVVSRTAPDVVAEDGVGMEVAGKPGAPCRASVRPAG